MRQLLHRPRQSSKWYCREDPFVEWQHQRDAGNPIQTFAKLLEKRPGVIYGAGTTAAFGLQVLPIQHALFAHLPADVVIVPLVFRGVHALWAKCPKGNLAINPGVVEVVVSPPIVGATTLLPRKRALRTQLELARGNRGVATDSVAASVGCPLPQRCVSGLRQGGLLERTSIRS